MWIPNRFGSFLYLQPSPVPLSSIWHLKCKKMHVGKTKENYKCTPVFLDNWTSNEFENKETGNIEFHEEYTGKRKVQDVTQVKYLGNTINSEGTNMPDIQGKYNRGIRTINKINTILETMYFGNFHFEVGKNMIEGMLLGTILNNIEVAYNLTKVEIEKLEKCHEMAMRKLLSLPSKTPLPMLYFLTGSTPIRVLIQRRRLVYLHHILNQDKESLLRSFFEQQLKTRKPKDWATTVLKDLEDFEIKHSLIEIQNISISQWKEKVKVAATKSSLSYLNSKVGSKSRAYNELNMAKYLCPNDHTSIETAKFKAKTQCHMIETIKANFKHDYESNLNWNSCKLSECNQSHLIYCNALIGSNQLVTYIQNYEDIFNDEETEEQNFIAQIMIENLKRKKGLEM